MGIAPCAGLQPGVEGESKRQERWTDGVGDQEGLTGVVSNLRKAFSLFESKQGEYVKRVNSTAQHISAHLPVQDAVDYAASTATCRKLTNGAGELPGSKSRSPETESRLRCRLAVSRRFGHLFVV